MPVKFLALFAVLTIATICGCSNNNGVSTPGQFTKEYADALQTASPGTSIQIVKDMELKVAPRGGSETTCFLDNAYDTYKQDPASKTAIIQKFVSAYLDTITSKAKTGVDTTRIVPVIKDRPWLEETRMALRSRGAKEVPEMVSEDFSPDLIILYAEDSPKNIRYLTTKDLAEAKIEQKDLRALACENLKKILPPIERVGTNGLYALTAGGDYEASLLLIDSIWDAKKLEVNGDFVVAIPSRGTLVVTGTGNPEAIASLREIAKKEAAEGAYRLTPKLFVRREGKFVEYNE
jgi:uncharacterized protein YtpQ (UPF0354 family)